MIEKAVNEAMRLATTRLFHVHCVATWDYTPAVIQLDEHPSNFHYVGGLGVDDIKQIKPLKRMELASVLDFRFKRRNPRVTFNPESLAEASSQAQSLSCLIPLAKWII